MRRLMALLAAISLVLVSCSSSGDSTNEVVSVVATTTILGDVVRAVVGDDGTVEVLLPPQADPHDYQPSSRQIAAMTTADLVVANGLGLEEGLDDVLEGTSAMLVGEQLDPRTVGDSFDPHVWLDPIRMGQAAMLIAERLGEIDSSIDWASRAEAYAATMESTDAEIRRIADMVPEDRRNLVSSHDALGYFAERYGFTVVGTLRPGGSTHDEPSSAHLAELVGVMAAEGATAIFIEMDENPALAETVAAEFDGAVTVVELFVGSLGVEGSGAETLSEMLVTNAERIVTALS
ncbi:MAG: zinc ABC transporter substrate-binding protein [Acidimicrobiia bacterium]|nr:zinc ABC transporter substrate-binding protein [Acidimicrobiia bacterium]